MTTVIDHRIADRRQMVSEAGARRRLRRILRVLLAAAFLGVGAWIVYQSSLLAVGQIIIDGENRSRVTEIVAAAGIENGMPTINVRPEVLESLLLEDPWIAAASVVVTWPGTVDVAVLEHQVAAWVAAGETWLLVSLAGTVLEQADDPIAALPVVDVASIRVEPGAAIDLAAAAAVEFLDSLEGSLAATAEITGSVNHIEARVAGHHVLLGYASDMGDKARTLTALLDAGVPAGAEISLVSPQRPAIKPQVKVETSGEVLGDTPQAG